MGKNNRHWHKRPNRPASDYKPPYSEEVLSTSVESLNLSAETLEILQKGGVLTVGHIVSRRKNEMYKVQNFNKKRLFEVVNAISPLGVDFRPDEAPAADKKPQQPGQGQQNDRRREDGAGKNDRRQENKPREDRHQDDRARNNGGNQPRNEDRRQGREEQRQGQRNDRPQQQDNNKKNNKGKQDNSVDFSKIFPREPLVHSPRIEPEKDIFTKFQRAGKWGFKDQSGKEVIPPIYTEALAFKEDMAAVEMNGLFGYINRENVLVIPYKYDTAGSFSEGWANVSLGEKCGYVDKTGKETVPFIYDAATPFTGEGYGRVKKDGRWGNIRKDGEVTWQ